MYRSQERQREREKPQLTKVPLAAAPAGSEDSLQETTDAGVHTHTALFKSTVDQLLVHVSAGQGVQWTSVLQHCHWEVRQAVQNKVTKTSLKTYKKQNCYNS